MSDTFLTKEEVAELTGRKTKSKQIEQLRAMGAAVLGKCDRTSSRGAHLCRRSARARSDAQGALGAERSEEETLSAWHP
jgi:hypothetical protein